MLARSDDKPIWYTEFGWSSCQEEDPIDTARDCVTDAQQADYLKRALDYIGINQPYVKNAFWYNERDISTSTNIREANFGLLTSTLSEKPAYTALKEYLSNVIPPTVTLTSPTATDRPSGTFNVTADASDNVAVAKVEFYINGELKNTDTTSPYAWPWDTTTYPNAQYTVEARAYDTANSASSSVAVFVDNGSTTTPPPPQPADTTAPTPSITSPANGARVSRTVNISASATDNVGVTSMEVYIDGKLYSSSQSGTLTTTWNVKPKSVAHGAHTLTVKAKDAAGNVEQSSITVYK
jgi:hypothetical protein